MISILTACGWRGHWTNGGTGITKFEPNKLPIYKQAVQWWNERNPNHALRVDAKNSELHSERAEDRKDLSKFWNKFEAIEKGNKSK